MTDGYTRRTLLAAVGATAVGGVTAGVLAQRTASGVSGATIQADGEVVLDDKNLYDATLVEIIDGDTADFIVDVGLNTKRKIRVRPTDIDTAEIFGVSEDSDEYARGRAQKQFVEELLSDADRLVFRSEEDTAAYNERFPHAFETTRSGKGGFGRWLGDINADGVWWSEAVLERWPDATYDG